MALDGIFLYSITQELTDTMLGCKINKINQPEKDEICLTFKKNRMNYKLLISSSANYPRIHFTDIAKKNPVTPPMFCMVLRKYLNNSRVVSIEQIDADRILKINFESTDELGFNSIYSLIIEIMGRHSNITLVRDRDSIVMDSIKHITPDINSYRSLYPGIKYVYPPKSTKLNPFDFSYEEFIDYFRTKKIEFNELLFMKMFTGISKNLSNQIFSQLIEDGFTTDNITLEDLYKYFNGIIASLMDKNFEFSHFKFNNNFDFHCVPFSSEKISEKQLFDSPSKLLENFYYKKDKNDRLNAKSSDLQRLVHNNIDRCSKKIKILERNLEDCKQKEKYKLLGELLTANIYLLKKGMSDIEVLNYYSEQNENIKIKLDVNKTPSENIQRYYKKYNKLKKSEEMATIQLDLAVNELNYFDSVMTNIKNCENEDELDFIRMELSETGYLRYKHTSKNKKPKKSQPLHFISSDGNDIYVGKNNIENDYLSLKFASKSDMWLHTKNIPGSHVIIKGNKDISDKTLEEAANLAAYYSKGKNSTKVPVDYTEVRNLRKPNGAKPGMVIYYTNQTIYMDPVEPTLEKTN